MLLFSMAYQLPFKPTIHQAVTNPCAVCYGQLTRWKDRKRTYCSTCTQIKQRTIREKSSGYFIYFLVGALRGKDYGNKKFPGC